MAFVPHTTFLTPFKFVRSVGKDAKEKCCTVRRSKVFACDTNHPAEIQVKFADAMEFFRHREGNWTSWRVTHHLAFRRSEDGASKIQMKCLEKTDERIISLCKDWDMDPAKAQGGCYVTWKATMAWDQEGENHEGSTVFALVPDENNIRQGKILRDRGYAEIVPIAGTYHLDEHDALNLNTPYEGGEVVETFFFDGPNVVNRMSTVRRFGGFSNATFATETRIRDAADKENGKGEESDEELEMAVLMDKVSQDASKTSTRDFTETENRNSEESEEELDVVALFEEMSCFASAMGGASNTAPEANKQIFSRAGRWGTTNSSSKPSTNSAFGSGFGSKSASSSAAKPSVNSAFGSGFGTSSSSTTPTSPETLEGISKKSIDAASDYGIDLSKVPPSMRQDFAASFDKDDKKST